MGWRDPRTVDLGKIFNGESRDPRTAESVRIFKRGSKDPWTAKIVLIFRGHAGIKKGMQESTDYRIGPNPWLPLEKFGANRWSVVPYFLLSKLGLNRPSVDPFFNLDWFGSPWIPAFPFRDSPQDPYIFSNGQTNRVTKYSGIFRPTENQSAWNWVVNGILCQKMGSENAWISIRFKFAHITIAEMYVAPPSCLFYDKPDLYDHLIDFLKNQLSQKRFQPRLKILPRGNS